MDYPILRYNKERNNSFRLKGWQEISFNTYAYEYALRFLIHTNQCVWMDVVPLDVTRTTQ